MRLMRWNSATGALLLYAPCAWGLALSGKASCSWYILFFIGAWFMRSAGCVLNDWADQSLDIHVPRTANRPLSLGLLTRRHVFGCGILCLSVGFGVWLMLPIAAKTWGLVGLVLAILYPWTKRFFWAPQLWLGVTFNIGVVVAYVAIKGQCDDLSLWLWASAAAWTVAYDTVYAFHDAPFDQQYGFYSTALWAQNHPRMFVGAFLLLHIGFLFPLIATSVVLYAVAVFMILWRWMPDVPASSKGFFCWNIWLAALLWFFIVFFYH